MPAMRQAARGRFIDTGTPRGYYVDYSRFAERWASTELPPSPAELARLALGDLELYLARGTPQRRDRFARAVERLVRSVETIPGGFVGWAMTRVPGAYRGELEEGWFCGRVHAECVSALLRAGTVLGDDAAVDTARAALGGFETPVEEGGFAREIAERGLESGLESPLFIESYPVSEPSLNLLGHTSAMLAVHDYGRLSEPERAASLLTRLASGLEYTLDRFDAGGWSLVDLDDRWSGRFLAGRALHREHILHLEEVARLTTRSAFRKAAERWRDHDARLLPRLRVLVGRVVFRMMNPGAPTG